MKRIKIITFILFMLSLCLIIGGYLIDTAYREQLIGTGVVVLFILVFPLFSYYRWKDKNLKDYMLTQENLDKMRENQRAQRH